MYLAEGAPINRRPIDEAELANPGTVHEAEEPDSEDEPLTPASQRPRNALTLTQPDTPVTPMDSTLEDTADILVHFNTPTTKNTPATKKLKKPARSDPGTQDVNAMSQQETESPNPTPTKTSKKKRDTLSSSTDSLHDSNVSDDPTWNPRGSKKSSKKDNTKSKKSKKDHKKRAKRSKKHSESSLSDGDAQLEKKEAKLTLKEAKAKQTEANANKLTEPKTPTPTKKPSGYHLRFAIVFICGWCFVKCIDHVVRHTSSQDRAAAVAKQKAASEAHITQRLKGVREPIENLDHKFSQDEHGADYSQTSPKSSQTEFESYMAQVTRRSPNQRRKSLKCLVARRNRVEVLDLAVRGLANPLCGLTLTLWASWKKQLLCR